MGRLAPCPSCRRHVRVDEASCPFCSATFDAPLVPIEGDGARRIPRIAAIALAAGVGAAGCTGGGSALYGVAMDGGDIPADAGEEDAGDDNTDDAGATAPLYGVAMDGGG